MPAGESLFSGRSREEMNERTHIKTDVLPKILLETLAANAG